MEDKGLLCVLVEEFSRLQDYMITAGKDSAVYEIMLKRYYDLKTILISYCISLNHVDRLKL